MIAIKNARVVLENDIIDSGVILVDGDRIAAVGAADEISVPEGAEVVDAKGNYAGPGFVDIHVHGGNGHLLFKEPLEGAEHFLSHGETTVLPTFYYDLSKEGFLEHIALVKSVIGKGLVGKAIGGFYMEGPYMNPKYGASPEKNKWRGEIKREDYAEILKAAGDYVKVWAIAPERPGIAGFMADAKLANPNVSFAVGHSEALPAEVRLLRSTA